VTKNSVEPSEPNEAVVLRKVLATVVRSTRVRSTEDESTKYGVLRMDSTGRLYSPSSLRSTS
jgi:hypothetical protein